VNDEDNFETLTKSLELTSKSSMLLSNVHGFRRFFTATNSCGALPVLSSSSHGFSSDVVFFGETVQPVARHTPINMKLPDISAITRPIEGQR
jgi:hypothetical protein